MIVFEKQHYQVRMYWENGCTVCNTRNGMRYTFNGYKLNMDHVASTWIHGEAKARRFARRCEAHGAAVPAAVVAVAQGKKSCAGYIRGWL